MDSKAMQVSRQWASRPMDERFTSLSELVDHVHGQRERSRARVLSSRRLRAVPVEDTNHQGLAVLANDEVTVPTHLAFGQLAQRADSPAAYLRKLPAHLAADCINWGMDRRDVEDIGIMSRTDNGPASLVAATGPNYGRVWNSDVAGRVLQHFGEGDWRIPGEFGKRVPITKANTTLYAGEQDMFICLADETPRNLIELKGRRGNEPTALSRGVIIWNSEVGAATLGWAAFLFDYMCSNRIIWGMQGYQELRIRHTAGAPDRFIEELAPALVQYTAQDVGGVVQALEAAKAKRLEDVDKALALKFTRSEANAIKLAFTEDEGRPIETLWDVTTGATAYARSIPFMDERTAIERKAGTYISLAA